VGNGPRGVAVDERSGNIFVANGDTGSATSNSVSVIGNLTSSSGGILGLPGVEGYFVIAGAVAALGIAATVVVFAKRNRGGSSPRGSGVPPKPPNAAASTHRVRFCGTVLG